MQNISSDSLVTQCAAKMASWYISSLVVNEASYMVGIVTSSDLLEDTTPSTVNSYKISLLAAAHSRVSRAFRFISQFLVGLVSGRIEMLKSPLF